ncbi:MAG: hypothetical protein UT32_C0002G0075 [Parcubacteria group bacterium GW2011_GWC2_39_14]|nr:MAG: hypothetical protein UT32_C0002G0075 [Parcubacteria group bacterium GW2011_GWC2_39_14]KKR55300.1 MAG: hypothetical protein UT91_C0003G0075 [Parcubacteria group bacterium GW2011_GWA2_40_23]
MERNTGVGPASLAWEANIIPLYEFRNIDSILA